jgi:hypothetical protein
MKVLAVCAYGNVRSSCLARQLKDWYFVDALAAGLVANTPETLTMLFNWADLILMTDMSLDPKNYIHSDVGQEKIRNFDVGRDRWGTPTAPELAQIMTDKIEESKLFPPRRTLDELKART